MVYGLETVTVTKKQIEEMEVAEIKMLRFAMGGIRKDKIRNKFMGLHQGYSYGRTVRNEDEDGSLRWHGHFMRRDRST